MSDIMHYNQSLTVLSDSDSCAAVRLRDLFVSTERYLFESTDQVHLCTCHKDFCNSAPSNISIHFLIFLIRLLYTLL
ncbi:unnamed protein product [Gongylonema pulchrum]|uniref:Protein sleepless n=1 Tax=Gongylonema pulchrum TaxID=637853 RepID=A0A183D5I6_9BILA|nr:unnamed protein product [Gongylonema pulchrum]